jgi:hypothetical protein
MYNPLLSATANVIYTAVATAGDNNEPYSMGIVFKKRLRSSHPSVNAVNRRDDDVVDVSDVINTE